MEESYLRVVELHRGRLRVLRRLQNSAHRASATRVLIPDIRSRSYAPQRWFGAFQVSIFRQASPGPAVLLARETDILTETLGEFMVHQNAV